MPLLYRSVTITQQELAGFECSRCGKSHEDADFLEMQEMTHISGVGGYGSCWGDGVSYQLELCQSCAHELFSPIAIIRKG